MQNELKRTIVALTEMFQDNKWCTITIVMRSNKHKLTITPIAKNGAITNGNDVALYHVSGSPLTDLNATSIKALAQTIIDYDDNLLVFENQKNQLFDFYTKYINIENPATCDLTSYSDDHKSLFGFRPGREFGQPRI